MTLHLALDSTSLLHGSFADSTPLNFFLAGFSRIHLRFHSLTPLPSSPLHQLLLSFAVTGRQPKE